MPVATIPQISTVLLNWNRLYLLKKCIISYLQTVTLPAELIIVDNHSTDGSRNFIRRICQKDSRCSHILLAENEGGRALNRGLRQARGRLLHISENDLIYKPGWDRQIIDKFNTFPELGQLSLFSPFSQDSGEERDSGEAREEGEERAKKDREGAAGSGEKSRENSGHKYYSRQICRNGKTIYVTDRNVGTSSAFRRELWRQGLRWNNTGSRGFKFPDDHAFSVAVRGAGYLAAWNDEYLVVNLGHTVGEFINNFAYYLDNYRAKRGGLKRFQLLLKLYGYQLIPDGKNAPFRIVPFNR